MSRWVGWTRTAAKREVSGVFVPLRHVTVRHAADVSPWIRAFAATGSCPGPRRRSFGGRLVPLQGFGGNSVFHLRRHADPAPDDRSAHAIRES